MMSSAGRLALAPTPRRARPSIVSGEPGPKSTTERWLGRKGVGRIDVLPVQTAGAPAVVSRAVILSITGEARRPPRGGLHHANCRLRASVISSVFALAGAASRSTASTPDSTMPLLGATFGSALALIPRLGLTITGWPRSRVSLILFGSLFPSFVLLVVSFCVLFFPRFSLR